MDSVVRAARFSLCASRRPCASTLAPIRRTTMRHDRTHGVLLSSSFIRARCDAILPKDVSRLQRILYSRSRAAVSPGPELAHATQSLIRAAGPSFPSEETNTSTPFWCHRHAVRFFRLSAPERCTRYIYRHLSPAINSASCLPPAAHQHHASPPKANVNSGISLRRTYTTEEDISASLHWTWCNSQYF